MLLRTPLHRLASAALAPALLSAAAATAAQPPEIEPTESLGEWRGRWLRNTHAEAFVAALPYPRVVAFQLPGGEATVSPAPGKYSGIRTWFVEPVQNDESYQPAERPARLFALPDGGYLLVGGDPTATSPSQTRVHMEVRLSPDRPELHLRHGVENLSGSTRTFNAWSIVVFPTAGTAVVPWGLPGEDAPFRTVTYWPYTTHADIAGSLAPAAFIHDFGRRTVSRAFKVGLVSTSGKAFWVGDHRAVILSAPFTPGAPYPEGGGNVTIYHACNEPGKDGVGEIEHAGPLTACAPGATVWLDQSLRIETAPGGGPLSPQDWLSRLH